MKKKQDYAVDLLCVLLLVLLFAKQFMFQAESRIGTKIGMTAMESLGICFWGMLGIVVLLCVACFIKEERENMNFLAGMIASLCMVFLIFSVGYACNTIELSSTSGRVSMSLGSYLFVVLLYLIMATCNQYIRTTWKRAIVLSTSVLGIVVLVLIGHLDGLSMMKEYSSYQAQFKEYFMNHVSLSFKVVVSGIIFGAPLGWIAFKKQKAGGIIMKTLNVLESLPSLALICLMMFPLSYISNHVPLLKKWGVSGVGVTPVFCALFCYALFHIVNSVVGALKTVDYQYIDAARGMGMTQMQIMRKIELPMILPVIISGIRVSLINTILCVTIGSYIGFGGLGQFVLQGLNGFAIDIVMLGTLPIMGLVFFFDFILKQLVVVINQYQKYRGEVKL